MKSGLQFSDLSVLCAVGVALEMQLGLGLKKEQLIHCLTNLSSNRTNTAQPTYKNVSYNEAPGRLDPSAAQVDVPKQFNKATPEKRLPFDYR